MTWSDWIPAISSSTVLAVLGFITGTFYKAKVEKTIEHNFNIELEKLKTQLRKDEEALKADLRAKDEQLSALRTGALSGLAHGKKRWLNDGWRRQRNYGRLLSSWGNSKWLQG